MLEESVPAAARGVQGDQADRRYWMGLTGTLMSGMTNSAFADVTSLRSTEEQVVHLNNILKFAVFKRDRSLFAIGGPWNAVIDGGDPSLDCSCLIQTAIRHVKELVQVDLSNCTLWNRVMVGNVYTRRKKGPVQEPVMG
ncbi:hypothetical protein ABZP36_024875 [Zizania latifolia]